MKVYSAFKDIKDIGRVGVYIDTENPSKIFREIYKFTPFDNGNKQGRYILNKTIEFTIPKQTNFEINIVTEDKIKNLLPGQYSSPGQSKT